MNREEFLISLNDVVQPQNSQSIALNRSIISEEFFLLDHFRNVNDWTKESLLAHAMDTIAIITLIRFRNQPVGQGDLSIEELSWMLDELFRTAFNIHRLAYASRSTYPFICRRKYLSLVRLRWILVRRRLTLLLCNTQNN